MREQKKKKKKWLGIFLFILINVIVIGYTAFSEFKKGDNSASRFVDIDIIPIYIIAALLCFVVAILLETIKYAIMMHYTCGRASFSVAFKTAALGKYYDYITPSGIGGQPFQIYYLKKNGLPTAPSAVLPIVGFITMQIGFVILAAFTFIIGGNPGISPAIKVAAYFGLCFYLFIPAAILFFSFAPKTCIRILDFGIKVLSKIKIVKDPKGAREKSISTLEEYDACLKVVLSRKGLFVLLLFISLIYQASICSIPFFVLRAFGSQMAWFQSFVTVFYIYAAITFIPTPGNAGATEGSFYMVFSSLDESAFWAMLVWRFISFYLFIIQGISIYLLDSLRINRKKKLSP